MKKTFFLIVMILVVSGCHHRRDCPDVGNALNWRQNNFTTIVPAGKYRFSKIYSEDRDCPTPTMVRVPNSVAIIDELLSKGGKVSIFVVTKGSSKGENTLESECESLYLQVFGSHNNFSIIDRLKFSTVLNELALGQTGLMAEDSLSKIGKMSGATHIYDVSGLVERHGPFKTVYFRGRLIDIQTGRVLSVDQMED